MTISYWDEWCTGAVNLVDYCNIVGYRECAFFGVAFDADVAAGARILTYGQRKMIARYLCEAQEEVEDELNYAIIPTWYTVEPHDYRIPIVTKWGRVISGGVRGETDIALAQAVVHAADPAVITINDPLVADIDSIDEVMVYYLDTDFEIIPDAITIAGNILTINIPRCRMVGFANLDTPEAGVPYGTVADFQQTVDVKRIYNDLSTQAELVDPHNCNSLCSSGNCSEYTHSGCIYVRKPAIGVVDALPATYSSGAWVAAGCTRRYSLARLNYYAGLTSLTKKLQDAVIRLAHSKMYQEPCGYAPIKGFWDRDTNVPEVLSEAQANCPFGSSDGAWWAWKQVQSVKLRKMGIL